MKYTVPIAGSYRITQKFGQNLVVYEGIKGHSGIDFACNMGTPILAIGSGVIAEVTKDKTGYGNHIWQLVLLDGKVYDCFVYGHLEGFANIKAGDFVEKGSVIGYAGSTGYSTGPHLHLGGRRVRLLESNEQTKYQRTYNGQRYAIDDYENGYLGHYDFSAEVENLNENLPPVALRYGQPYSYTKELAWSLKYGEAKVRELALKAGFGHKEWPLMKNAFVYGYWPREVVFDTSAFALWAYNTKPAFDQAMRTKNLNSLKAPIPAIITK